MKHKPSWMDRIEAAMKFELEANKKLRIECEKLAQIGHELRVRCEKLYEKVCGMGSQPPGTTIKITPEMFKIE